MADVEEKPVEEVTKATGEEKAEAKEEVTSEENVAGDKTEEQTKEGDAKAAAGADAADAGDEDANGNAEGDGDAADDSANGITKLERQIIRQVEYYFGDANLNRDKFLRECIGKSEDGWVPFSVLLTFKRLATLSKDKSAIIDALSKSDEGLVEISEDREKIRRHPERPIPEHNEERRKEIMSRTAYAKGFPLDIEMAELIEFFTPYEKVLNITMRKYMDKPTKKYKFKGSVFVTFEKVEQTKEFIEKEKAMFKERELIRKWQEKYLEEKKEEMKNKANKKSKGKQPEEEKIELPKGAVLHFEGATETVTRELLREAVSEVDGDWEIAYIDFSMGDKDGHIRFQEENIAAKLLEKLEDKKLKLKGDIELTLRTLSDDEEKAFLDKAIEQMKNRRNHQNKHKGGYGGNRKRRGGGHGHGHHGGHHHDGAKKKKTEA